MALKRRPPTGNVRRVQAIGNNTRFTLVSKSGRSIQCESFEERKLVLLLERDRTVKDYLSQPEILTFVDKHGKHHRYVPDFKVWYIDSSVALHEVTIEERRQQKPSLVEREEAGRLICEAKSWNYIVHTEQVLPKDTELANLLHAYSFRPSSYRNASVVEAIQEQFRIQAGPILINHLIETLSDDLNVQRAVVRATLFHMLWHMELETDWKAGLLVESAYVASKARVWLVV
jgi:hypothetical protein